MTIIGDVLRELAAIAERLTPDPLGALNPQVAIRRRTVTQRMAEIHLFDDQKIQLSVAPRHRSGPRKGHIDESALPTWTSSDPSQVGVQIDPTPFVIHDDQFDEDVTVPGSFRVFATTPEDAGAAVVTVEAATYESVEFPISYELGAPGSLNASAGAPVPD